MKFVSSLFYFVWLSFLGCSDHAHKHGSLHVHQPLRGGVLYELGKHGSGHNFELVTNEKGQLELFVLDAHAENYVRISQKQIDLQIIDSESSAPLGNRSPRVGRSPQQCITESSSSPLGGSS